MAKEQQQRVEDEEQPELVIELSELVKKKTISLEMCTIYGYLCMRFIDFMMKSTNFLDYSNLLSPNKYEYFS